ncbi:MAG: alanine--glyoxylate aminotransferase family protein [Candidatus Omnitrophica bacterium]|nr:alanine--glyoxylate aminotransferase family protein [Candidatus Omnitrophota bacterium]
MKRNLLLTPGPTQIPPQLCAALGRPIIHHRTPQFQENLKEAVEGLQYVFQTKNDIYLIPASGTGAMEACVANLLSAGDQAITIEGGKFGERWTELCKAYGAKPEVVEVEWGSAVDPQVIKKLLDENKNIKVVFATLNETSTGVVTDIKALADVVKKTDALLVVDAISGLGVVDLKMDEWGVDVVASASHKGFMLPPGLAFVAVNDRAYKRAEQTTSPRYYFDFRKAKKAWEKVDTAFTPAIGIVIALCESLKWFKERGLEENFKNYARLAKGTQAAAKALGLTLLAKESCISNALTSINLPENIDGGKLVKIMRDTYGVSIAGGQGYLKGKIIRIAHMGVVDEYDILTGISCLEKVLKELGHKFELGAGLKAAQEVFNT